MVGFDTHVMRAVAFTPTPSTKALTTVDRFSVDSFFMMLLLCHKNPKLSRQFVAQYILLFVCICCTISCEMAGRPPKPEDEKRTATLRIRLTQDEMKIIEQASNGTKTSAWARSAILRSARRKATTIRVAWLKIADADVRERADNEESTISK